MDTKFIYISYEVVNFCGINLGNIPNALFIACAFVAFVIWTGMLFKYRRLQENE